MALTRQQEAAHLLRRAGFGGTAVEVAEFAALSHEAAVDRLLNYSAIDNSAMNAVLAREGAALDPAKIYDVGYYWLLRMIYSRHPLEEKMTLFWHNHFATEINKVKDPTLMQKQNDLFRRYALGNFLDLTKQVARDPAMIRYLDSNSNRKNSPNENWARELFELFTLGEGHYSEQDIKESARAFTGWFERLGAFQFMERQHDSGSKTIFGKTGNWNGDDVINMAASHGAAGAFLSRKLIAYFATDKPSQGFVERINAVYYASGYDVKAMVRAILLDPEFRSEASYRELVKSPADFVVGSFRSLEASGPNKSLFNAMRLMGMTLYDPPSVKGWDWGTDWISTTNWFNRANAANGLLAQRDASKPLYINVLGLLRRNGATSPEAAVNYLLNLLTDGDVTDTMRQELRAYVGNADFSQNTADADGKARGLAHLIVAAPAYQLL